MPKKSKRQPESDGRHRRLIDALADVGAIKAVCEQIEDSARAAGKHVPYKAACLELTFLVNRLNRLMNEERSQEARGAFEHELGDCTCGKGQLCPYARNRSHQKLSHGGPATDE